MSGWARLLFVVATSMWLIALLAGLVALRLLRRARGDEAAWPAARVFVSALDLLGTWLGTVAALSLLFGRRGFSPAWTASLGLVALMVTAGLYDRAVLVPSLDAAWKRLGAGGSEADRARWAADRRFLQHMSALAHGGTLAAGIAALACGLAA